MKAVFRHQTKAGLSYYRALLEEAGIPTFVRNDNVAVTTPTVPAFSPTLCVVNDADYDRAVAIIREADLEHAQEEASGETDEERPCPSCGKSNPGNFDYCWNCGGEFR